MAKKRKYHKRKTDNALTTKVIGTIVSVAILVVLGIKWNDGMA